MPIFRISAEVYDKAWYVKARSEKKAVSLVKEMTEGLGWHLEYPEEPRHFKCEKVFTEENEIIESRDM